MPTYAFRCRQCEHEFEELVKRFSETAPCPACGSNDVERAVSAPVARVGQRLLNKLRRHGGCGPTGSPFG